MILASFAKRFEGDFPSCADRRLALDLIPRATRRASSLVTCTSRSVLSSLCSTCFLALRKIASRGGCLLRASLDVLSSLSPVDYGSARSSRESLFSFCVSSSLRSACCSRSRSSPIALLTPRSFLAWLDGGSSLEVIFLASRDVSLLDALLSRST